MCKFILPYALYCLKCLNVLYDQIVSHLIGNNLLTPHQSGFRTQDSISVVTSRFTDGYEVVKCVLDFYKVGTL